MRAALITLGLALTTTPALASPVDQAQEPLRTSPVRTGYRPGGTPPEQSLLQIPTHEVACGGAALRPTYADDLRIETVRFGHEKPGVTLSFSITEDGRTRDIRPSSARMHPASDEIVISSTPPTDQDRPPSPRGASQAGCAATAA